MEVIQPQIDYLGEEFANRLFNNCLVKGYTFKFYTVSKDKNYDYDVIVY